MFAASPFRRLGAPVGDMTTSGPADEVLIARVAKRDKEALGILYDRHGAAAFGLALRIVGERSYAEEIVQESFWRVWKRAKTYKARRGRFTSWLFGIVHNLAIDELRRRRARPPLTSIDLRDNAVLDIPDGRIDVADSAYQAVASEQ